MLNESAKSRALHARVLYVLTIFACFTCSTFWRALRAQNFLRALRIFIFFFI